ncbi:hypothetical protein L6164_001421 [Bauhinia variegata]|uniref:Uncharacterized protein n=1 Tax=Bauhinia variegata TaxID=167791 RepID=A0ACB9Q9H9_BAUVA|nr:hypothetical protein L6164_001421 [Bauhinia variegata]
MQRRLRQVCTNLKEHSSVSLAKFASAGGFCDINLIIIKATAPDDMPLHEKYIHRLLKIFSISPSSYHSFSISFTRRFGTTRCWRVALKCLLLIHRLLQSVPDNSSFKSQLLWARSSSLISLHPCHFQDKSSSFSEDYTTFIRAYAQFIDETLICVYLDGKKPAEMEEGGGGGEEEEEREETTPETLQEKMKEIGEVLETLPQIQSLIDRVMDCRPIGVAAQSFIVQTAMRHIIRDSFACYRMFKTNLTTVLENLLQLPYKNCVDAFEIYKKASVQANQLCEFYDWCKDKGFCGFYEYPLVEKIPHLQIHALETFLNGIWELTASPSSQTISPVSLPGSSGSSAGGEGGENGQVRRDVVNKGNKSGNEEKPLIDLEEGEDVGWETLLESSISVSYDHHREFCFFSPNGYSCGWDDGIEKHRFDGRKEHEYGYQDGTRKVQIYKPKANNPFFKLDMTNSYGRDAHNSYNPWGF